MPGKPGTAEFCTNILQREIAAVDILHDGVRSVMSP
jgi:hypothetical protein